jgi:hypothetical protein
MALDNESLAAAFSEQYKDVEPVADREEALTGESTEFETEDPIQEETTEQPVAEVTEEEDREEENVEESEESEETTEQSSLNSEESSESEESNEAVVETTFDFDAELAKRTEGKYSNIDEIMQALDTPQEAKFEYANELVAKLDELAKQGVNVDLDFVTAQMVDYSKFDVEQPNQALDLIKQQLKLEEPDMTERELEFEMSELLQERYKIDEDEFDEDVIERSKMRLMRDAKKARKALEENQKKIALPTGGVDPEKQRQAEEQARAAQERLNKTLRDSLSKYEKESIQIGNETFSYELNSDTKKGLENSILNTDKFFHQYIKKDGSIDTTRLNSDMLWANPATREVMLKSFLQQATAKGSKDIVDDIKNTSIGKKTPAAQGQDNSQQAQIARHFEQKRLNNRF